MTIPLTLAQASSLILININEGLIDHLDIFYLWTGLSIQIPKNLIAVVNGMMNTTTKYGILVIPQVIDWRYKGEVVISAINFSKQKFHLRKSMELMEITMFNQVDFKPNLFATNFNYRADIRPTKRY